MVLGLEERNREARKIIDHYVLIHGSGDVGLGLVGLIPVPGAATAALMAAIALQAPVIYQPMARKLARVYSVSPDQILDAEDEVIVPQLFINSGLDIGAEFGVEFLKHIAGEILLEIGLGALLTAIPIFGAIGAAALDYKIANMMTNDVGKMVSAYFQNGMSWPGGSKESTYNLSKTLPSDLNQIRHTVSEVRNSQVRSVTAFIRVMRHAMTVDQMRDSLRKERIPDDLIEDALAKA